MELQSLLTEIENREIVVPEFQREYVWNRNQAKSLLHSLYYEYPVGGLLFWKVNKKDSPPLKKITFDPNDNDRINVILDGQQRLTALYLIIKGEVPPYYSRSEIKYDPKELSFNLVTEEFEYYQSTKMKNNPAWRKLTWLFNTNQKEIEQVAREVEAKGETGFAFHVLNVYLRLLGILKRDFPVQNIPLGTDELKAILIFDRVNNMGTKLSSMELALAYMQSHWKGARRELKKYREYAASKNFSFTIDFLVRCMVAVVKNGGLPETIHDCEKLELIEGWDKVKHSLDYLIQFLPKEAYVDGGSDMISEKTLIPLVSFLTKHDYAFNNESRRKALYWFYLATLWSRYSSRMESNLQYDVRTVSENEDPFPQLVEDMRKQRRLELEASDLEKVKTTSGISRMVLIAAKHAGARDWFLGNRICGGGDGRYSLEYHHIFPSSILYKNGYNTKNDAELVHELANLAFLTQKTNRRIANSRPIDYLPDVEKNYPGSLEYQFVPLDRNLWEIENYRKFLTERRRLIVKSVNDILENLRQPLVSEIDYTAITEAEESQFLEFKSTLRVDTQGKGLAFKVIEEQVLKSVAGFLNQDDGGTLVIGIDDDKNVVGLERDYSTFPKKNRDSFQLHFFQLVSANLGKEYERNVSLDFIQIKGKDVAIVKVSKAYRFVHFNGQNYIRMHNRTVQLSPAEAAEYIRRVWG